MEHTSETSASAVSSEAERHTLAHILHLPRHRIDSPLHGLHLLREVGCGLNLRPTSDKLG